MADNLENRADVGVDAAEDVLGTLKDLGGKAGDLARDALGALGKLGGPLPSGFLSGAQGFTRGPRCFTRWGLSVSGLMAVSRGVTGRRVECQV